MIHPWHDLKPGAQAPEEVTGIIEIPRYSTTKYELDKESGLLKLDRVLYSAVYYPANYGFIPQTYCDDGDPLDILVLSQVTMHPMCMVKARVIGVMRMLDSGEADDKIIAVASNDMSVNHIREISDVPDHYQREMKNFFEDYKKLEHKKVVVEDFQPRETALKIIRQAIEDYKKSFGKTPA